MLSERYSVDTRHHELFVCICRIMEAREMRHGKAADTLTKLGKVYDEGLKVRVEAHVAEWNNLRERLASLTSDVESKALEFQVLSGFASEAA